MAVRRESVMLRLDSNVSTVATKDALAVALLNRELKRTDGAQAFTREATRAARSGDALGLSLNTAESRISLIVRSLALVGPAFAPIATAAVPAVTGLVTQLGFAATAAGVSILAFQGVGDALDALRDYSLEPTTDNLEAAREALDKLSPAAQTFVMRLRDMADEFRAVRDAASEGLMPGLINALDSIEILLPKVERIVSEVADATGDLLAGGASSLASNEWADFFAFVEAEARPTLMTLGTTVGNVAKGIAELFMALDPATDDFTQGLLNVSESFESWAESLSETRGFQEFLDYVHDTGPQVAETLGSMALAIVRIGEAASPLGGPALRALEGVADAISSIMDSPLGTPIMAAATAMAALSLAQGAWGRIATTSWGQAIAGAQGYERQVAATRRAAGVGIAAVAALGLAAQESATGFDATNTAMGVMAGTMVGGVWGAAIFGGIGLTLDLANANDDLWEALDRANEALEDSGPASSAFQTALDGARQKVEELRDTVEKWEDSRKEDGGRTSIMEGIIGTKNEIEGLFGQSDLQEAEAELAAVEAAALRAAESGAFFATIYGPGLATTAEAFHLATLEAEDFHTALSDVNSILSDQSTLIAYEEGLDRLREGMKENGRTFDVTTDKGRANWENLIRFTNAAIERAEAFKEQGEDLAATKVLTRALEDLKNFAENGGPAAKAATADLIAELEELAGKDPQVEPKVKTKPGHRRLNDLERHLLGLPPGNTRVNVRTRAALSAIREIRRQLGTIHDVNVAVRVEAQGSARSAVRNFFAGTGYRPPGFAHGGYTGRGHKYEPAGVVHRDEFVFSKEATQGNVGYLDSLHRQLRGYADGGHVRPAPMSTAPSMWEPDYDRLASAMAGLMVLEGELTLTPDGRAFVRGEARRELASAASAAGRGF